MNYSPSSMVLLSRLPSVPEHTSRAVPAATSAASASSQLRHWMPPRFARGSQTHQATSPSASAPGRSHPANACWPQASQEIQTPASSSPNHITRRRSKSSPMMSRALCSIRRPVRAISTNHDLCSAAPLARPCAMKTDISPSASCASRMRRLKRLHAARWTRVGGHWRTSLSGRQSRQTLQMPAQR